MTTERFNPEPNFQKKESEHPPSIEERSNATPEKDKDALVSFLANIRELKSTLSGTEKTEEAEKRLREAMEKLRAAADHTPPEESTNEPIWIDLYKEFQSLVDLKKQSKGDIGKVFELVFEEYRDFIEDELVYFAIEELKLTGKKFDLQEIIGKLYGYTMEEYYATKDRNRDHVVDKVQELRDQPEITFETIEQLHAINNQGIVAKSASRLRRDPEDISTFSVRVGILSEDVQAEVNDIVARANNLITEIPPEQRLSTLKRIWYEIRAAKLHNDLLDVHPFLDRNGSTSLLFLELMMSKVGYEPSPKRESNYYNHIRKALNNNLAAIALIASEMFRIKFVPGHYRGVTTQSPDKQKQYKESLQRKRKMNDEEKNN